MVSETFVGYERYMIERKIGDLEKEMWIFWFHETTLILDGYAYLERETKRHKFKPIREYERLKDNRYGEFRIQESEVPLPQDVIDEALERVRSKITVKRWSEKRR